MPSQSERPKWNPRVPPALIRRLYESDATGIVDGELIDEAGYSLLVRCESIRRVTYRLCHKCGEKLDGVAENIGRHDRPIHCTGCGWTSTWGVYHGSYKGERVHGGGAFAAFLAFLDNFPRAGSPQAKMRAIDALIHAVHGAGKFWTLPGANNLIAGTNTEVIDLLNDLAGLPGARPEAVDAHRQFRRCLENGERLTRQRYGEPGQQSGNRPFFVVPLPEDRRPAR